MKTTMKRGEDLRRGSVITDFLGAASASVPAVVLYDWSAGRVTIMDAEGTVRTPMIGYDSTVLVEAPALTPAQEHAEELLHMLRAVRQDARDGMMPDRAALDDLLAKIDPPKAPTYEEALLLLESLAVPSPGNMATIDWKARVTKAMDAIDRARRANVMP